ncbi:MAG: 3-deoxy-manno-octulosonate cytidylyltransferase [Armatimonadetes bacterium]|nr:3-deoxy-manno-octulosonate cytidylyltransferase [Armatimonadota bacterium]NIM24656.1 3-deoxy-manno-octulosonate cytidylyltransferase [Armatimonadota bacterium]NIM68535.1 3-deoxy-manno-octulosonate cytidylyltransferase [Armatimonadota bacterium]NIM76917.1 3-deoxy-manno-octulosonate cytidylyltransferase [Armatimonadota bacterium]NIN06729.1 3-deoxy-manno-octulosonate cytidylyltransferase [Armatimonadota bacterium]
MTRIIGIIPARWASTRLEGKALAPIAGKPMIQHVYERARQAPSLERLLVATDDERIFQAVVDFGGEAKMTSPHHPSGTDRVAEVAVNLDADIIVNIQGDEPLIEPSNIEAALAPMIPDPTIPMGTLRVRISDEAELHDPAIPKVVVDRQGFALYFSRFAIPFVRDEGTQAPFFRHIGLYAYRRDFLLKLATLAPTPLEKAEALEQLRALEHGHRIIVSEVAEAATGIDTPEQLEKIRCLLENPETQEEECRR